MPKGIYLHKKRPNHGEVMKKIFSDPVFISKHSNAVKEAMQRTDVQNKIHKPKGPMTLSGKVVRSNALVGKRPKNFYNVGISKQGWIEFPGGRRHYMLSRWERNIARYLEFLMINGKIRLWEYEPKKFIFERINFGNRTYLPDFRVTENNGSQYYIEVKGWMTPSSKTKLNRMKKYFPDVVIRLINQKEYRTLKKQLSKILSGWEEIDRRLIE